MCIRDRPSTAQQQALHSLWETSPGYVPANMGAADDILGTGAAAVSYTHLDVYKRQHMYSEKEKREMEKKRRAQQRKAQAQAAQPESAPEESAPGAASVSYTHLDVYKRQRHEF